VYALYVLFVLFYFFLLVIVLSVLLFYGSKTTTSVSKIRSTYGIIFEGLTGDHTLTSNSPWYTTLLTNINVVLSYTAYDCPFGVFKLFIIYLLIVRTT
jgi:hypothetical protein